MKTIVFFTLVSLVIVATFDWSGKKYFEEPIEENPNEESGYCGVAGNSENGVMASMPLTFKAKCATCHMLEKDGTGPALVHSERSFRDRKHFEAFIRNQDSLIRKKDNVTLEIMKKKPVNFMHNYSGIDEKQMEELVQYFK